MKKLLVLVFVLLSMAVSNSNQVHATHFAGADLTYTCLGGNSYHVVLSFYRDCSGITVQDKYKIKFVCSSNSNYTFEYEISQRSGTGQEITPGCNAMPTSCSGTGRYGIREYVYEGQVTLPPCQSWELSFFGSARNPITTLSTTGNWYMPAMLDNKTAPCNSSPTFSNKPVAVVCVGQEFCFNHGALDPDGDSLSYSFYAPKTAEKSSVQYRPGYSYTKFLDSSTPITLDPQTGDICFTPTSVLTTVTGIKVEEWREINDTMRLIGTVYRDIQLKTVMCDNYIPVISGMDTLLTATYNPADTVYKMDRCLSVDSIKFHINGNDSDVFDPTVLGSAEKFSITWNNGIPGANFVAYNNGTDSAYAEFSWLPTADDISNNYQCFTATIQDSACPYNGSQTFSYCIIIRGMMVDIGTDSLLCEGEHIRVEAEADTTTENYIWRVNGQLTGTPPTQNYYDFYSGDWGPGEHVLSIETNDGATTTACPGVDQIVLNVVDQPEIAGTLPDSAFCVPGDITYDAGSGGMYLWSNYSANGMPVGNQQTQTFELSGIYTIQVDGGENTRCLDSDTFQVISIQSAVLGSDTCIWESEAPYSIDAGFTDPGNIYEWNTGLTGGSEAQVLDVMVTGEYTVSISHKSISTSVKCPTSQRVNVIDQDNFISSILYMTEVDEPLPEAEWVVGDRDDVCTYQRLRMTGPEAAPGYTYDYLWKQGGLVVSDQPDYYFVESTQGAFTISLYAGGCEDDVVITTSDCQVDVPNVFTPNGDLTNQYFRIVLEGTTEDFYNTFPNSQLIIYNRWGKKVYESNNYQNDWDGENLSDGTYFWVLRLEDGKDTELTGTVNILRD